MAYHIIFLTVLVTIRSDIFIESSDRSSSLSPFLRLPTFKFITLINLKLAILGLITIKVEVVDVHANFGDVGRLLCLLPASCSFSLLEIYHQLHVPKHLYSLSLLPVSFHCDFTHALTYWDSRWSFSQSHPFRLSSERCSPSSCSSFCCSTRPTTAQTSRTVNIVSPTTIWFNLNSSHVGTFLGPYLSVTRIRFLYKAVPGPVVNPLFCQLSSKMSCWKRIWGVRMAGRVYVTHIGIIKKSKVSSGFSIVEDILQIHTESDYVFSILVVSVIVQDP